jgi:hypothetical protein
MSAQRIDFHLRCSSEFDWRRPASINLEPWIWKILTHD